MTLSSTSQLNSLLAQILSGPRQGAGPAAGAAAPASAASPAAAPGLADAVLDALRQIGVKGSAGANSSTQSGSTSTQSTSALALQSFMQTLLAALQPQGGTGLPLQGHGAHAAHAAHGVGGVERRLNSLIQQLESPSGSAGGTAPPGTPLAALQTSFGQLTSALGGGPANSAGLGTFLNTLSSDLAARSSTGQLVSTQA